MMVTSGTLDAKSNGFVDGFVTRLSAVRLAGCGGLSSAAFCGRLGTGEP